MCGKEYVLRASCARSVRRSDAKASVSAELRGVGSLFSSKKALVGPSWHQPKKCVAAVKTNALRETRCVQSKARCLEQHRQQRRIRLLDHSRVHTSQRFSLEQLCVDKCV